MENSLDSLDKTLNDFIKELDKIKTTDDLLIISFSECFMFPLRYLNYELKRIKEEEDKKIEENKKRIAYNKVNINRDLRNIQRND